MSQLKGQFVIIDDHRNERSFPLRRQNVIQLCGWTSVDGKGVLYDRLGSLIERDEYEKVAAIYIFQMNVTRALEVLHDGHKRGTVLLLLLCRRRRRTSLSGGREELATLILALVGFIRANNDDQTLINDISPVAKLFHRPYVRAMFAFILAQDGNDLQYESVLVRCSLFSSLLFPSMTRVSLKDEPLDLNDKVAFTARYLNDQRLHEKLDKLAEEAREKGDLQGILLTGAISLVTFVIDSLRHSFVQVFDLVDVN